ncbi:hypothetical protein M427DRAFT_46057 [Gonapodya prolifera JEL478]|uniref:Protein kinase domain-containing protein n=1 Tax=Gonapodya prolifera (strain JEL478) TaxID=1344416 RepID=A0A139A8F4_GONPJ|nr:hypothetical protein M427DRAFT_46057 [Gonapodya prolifera JEL478]|eukprot:KXS12984.1 hypothetical protein M427DRAFT_46057 [Gonapodya prolifera JEL478]
MAGAAKGWYRGSWKLLGPVAVKSLNADFSDDRVQRAFLDEVKVWASILPHDNIVPLHSACIDAQGAPFMISRLMESDAIAYLQKMEAEGASMTPLKIKLVSDTMEGISHLSLKPGNILVRGEGRDGSGLRLWYGQVRSGKYRPSVWNGLILVTRRSAPANEPFSPGYKASPGPRHLLFWDHLLRGLDCWTPVWNFDAEEFQELKMPIAFSKKRPELLDARFKCMPNALRDLMAQCWDKDPASRPECFARGIVPVMAGLRHHELALRRFQKAADSNNGMAQIWLGEYYCIGYGAASMYECKTVELWQQVADQGYMAG